jgi:hypothetical protein
VEVHQVLAPRRRHCRQLLEQLQGRHHQHTIQLRKPYISSGRIGSTGVEVEWWDLQDGVLTQLLATSEGTLDNGRWSEPGEPRFEKWWFELRGPPPVTVVRFTRSCVTADEKTCEPVTQERFAPRWVAMP